MEQDRSADRGRPPEKHVAVIFAGGTGERMGGNGRPKQFLEYDGKPVLAYTLDCFQRHGAIDSIILVSLREWIGYCETMVRDYGAEKVAAIVPGGKTGQASIRNGLIKAGEMFDAASIVLIHDGVRPLVDGETLDRAIACTRQNGTAVTVAPAVETILYADGRGIGGIVDRSQCCVARAPQCFRLGDILQAHGRAQADGLEFIDSASLMAHYGHRLYTVNGPLENIKITTMTDFYMFCAMMDARKDPGV